MVLAYVRKVFSEKKRFKIQADGEVLMAKGSQSKSASGHDSERKNWPFSFTEKGAVISSNDVKRI